jgi:hypothetical protein
MYFNFWYLLSFFTKFYLLNKYNNTYDYTNTYKNYWEGYIGFGKYEYFKIGFYLSAVLNTGNKKTLHSVIKNYLITIKYNS